MNGQVPAYIGSSSYFELGARQRDSVTVVECFIPDQPLAFCRYSQVARAIHNPEAWPSYLHNSTGLNNIVYIISRKPWGQPHLSKLGWIRFLMSPMSISALTVRV